MTSRSNRIASVESWRLPTASIKETWGSDTSVWPKDPINFLVKVTLESGEYGVGELGTMLWYYNETPEQIVSLIRVYDQALRGADPVNLRLCHARMKRAYGGGVPGGRGARSAVDMALFDLVGKLFQVPAYMLMGGASQIELPMMFCTYADTPDAAVDACRTAVSQGFQAVKVKVGDRMLASGWNQGDLSVEIDKLNAVLDSVPSDILIDADANQGWWNAGTTVAALRSVRPHSNFAIEQPLSYTDIAGSAHIRAASGVPLILDESVWSAEAMSEIVKANACDRVVCKLNRLGGMLEARTVIAICDSAGIGVGLDTAPYTVLGDTACFHAAASCKTVFPVDEGHLSMIKLTGPPIFSGGVRIENGRGHLPDTPGLGVTVDWAVLA